MLWRHKEEAVPTEILKADRPYVLNESLAEVQGWSLGKRLDIVEMLALEQVAHEAEREHALTLVAQFRKKYERHRERSLEPDYAAFIGYAQLADGASKIKSDEDGPILDGLICHQLQVLKNAILSNEHSLLLVAGPSYYEMGDSRQRLWAAAAGLAAALDAKALTMRSQLAPAEQADVEPAIEAVDWERKSALAKQSSILEYATAADGRTWSSARDLGRRRLGRPGAGPGLWASLSADGAIRSGQLDPFRDSGFPVYQGELGEELVAAALRHGVATETVANFETARCINRIPRAGMA